MAFQRLRGHSVHRGSSRGQVITGQLVGATSARNLGVYRWISPEPLALRSFSASTTPLGHLSWGHELHCTTLRQETGRAGASETLGKDLTITTKPTLNGRWIFSFPEEAGTQTDVWACVSEMHMKFCALLGLHKPCASYLQGGGRASLLMTHYHWINALGTRWSLKDHPANDAIGMSLLF